MRASRLAASAALAAATFAATARAEAPFVWSNATRSPHPATPAPDLAALYAACGAPDAALAAVAARAVDRLNDQRTLPNADELSFGLRAEGDPHPWPRAFGFPRAALDDATLAAKLKPWATGATTLGARRCGLARTTAGGETTFAAIAVDAIADLSAPLPTRARVGQWLTLEAKMLVPASEAKVVLLGPRGAPKTVLASLEDGRVRSTFAVDANGPWLVQVLATVSTGPRPAIEAIVYAGVEPPAVFSSARVPGEDAGKGALDDADAVLRMINAARASEGLGDVRRDAALDRLAAAHADAMRKKNLVGHDVGDGDVMARAQAAGVSTGKVLGENVANAPTIERAHRALWGSPSHRTNLLYAGYRSVGVGVVRDGGVAWIAEIFRD
jgi:uncharacterized protein YkwD